MVTPWAMCGPPVEGFQVRFLAGAMEGLTMDPATDAILQIWDTAATVDGIYSRLGDVYGQLVYLNWLLVINAGLLLGLIRLVAVSKKKDGEQ